MTKYLAASIARVAAIWLLTGPAALAQTADAATASPGTVKLTTVIMAIPAGTPFVTFSYGLVCLLSDDIRRAPGGREPQTLLPYTPAFKTEMEQAGFKVVAEDDLFNREPEASDFQVAAVITDARINACVSRGGLLSAGKPGDAKGTGSITVDWQVYSPLRKEVVAHLSTSGSFALQNSVSDGQTQLVVGAFAAAARALAASAEFRTAMSAAPASKDVLPSAQQSVIVLSGSKKAAKRPVADAIGSVVTILTGEGTGSGVLISDDGYVLTNDHVVGDAKEIRVRWSDGIEKPAEVVRVSKPRDVALVKTDPRDRPPFPIRRGAVTPGERVYAIGSPNGPTFAGTVSSGVVSASRTLDGFSFIQSDVSVSPGSSGGALLDENGALLGITEGGIKNEGQSAGLNIFIPVGDAMDFLSLEQD